MANLNNIKLGWRQFLKGYLSVGNLFNMSANQIIYALTAAYFWSGSILRGRPGLMQIKSKFKESGKEKKVLISFVLQPLFKTFLVGRIRYYFSINGLTLFIVRAFNELGYTCHVIYCIDNEFIVKDDYQAVVFGDVANYETVSAQLSKDCKQIAFQTGAYWKIHNIKEEERFQELKQRTGVDLPRDRWAKNGDRVDNMLHKVSGIIALGDHFTKETFQTLPHTYPINSAFLEDFRFYENDILKKDFSIARKNFVYIGGGGEVHKGLDLLLEVFHKLPDLNLYICTNFSPGFSKLYENLLSKSPNIHFIGYLPQRSKGFYNLMKNCAFNLHLSCSEGSPGGVIEVLQYGIIPVVSYESNINVENFGFQLQSHSLEEITQMVLKLSKLPAEEARKLALQTRRIGFEKFSTSVFLKNLKHIFKDEIKIP